MELQVDLIERKWYVVYTMPKAEKRVTKVLGEKEIEAFVPLYEKLVQRSDRKKKIWTPLFPGYVFIYLGLKEINKVFGTPGILKFISTQGQKDIVPAKEIKAIKQLLNGKPEVCNDHLKLGQEVEVKHGPLSGLRGELINYKGKKKLVVLLKSLKQNVVVEVDLHQVVAFD